MPVFRDGSTNILSLDNPGAYVDQILPNANPSFSATNIEAFVGVGSWGPVGAVVKGMSTDDLAAQCGVAMIRDYDIASFVMAATQCGDEMGYAYVRVTDGTDTAATAAVPGGTFTGRYTGSRGNLILTTFQPTSAAGAYAALVKFPGRQAERFDNIRQALSSLEIVPGVGYTSVPSLALGAPGTQGGIQAIAQLALAAVAIAIPAGKGGSGHAVNDVVSFGNGVAAKVTAVDGSGAITTATITAPGKVASGAVPTTVGVQTGSTGAGVGANVSLSWGLALGRIVNQGYGYPGAMSATIVGGGQPTTPGSVTPVTSFWSALAYAINNGTFQRGKSACVIFADNGSTVAPVLGVTYALAGGTDGDTGVTDEMLLGSDVQPRTGMYALRSSKVDSFTLCDCFDSLTWGAQTAFAIQEGMLGVAAMPSGTTIEDAVAERLARGIDDPNFQILAGDWPTIQDTQNQVARLINPCAIALGMYGNLSPEQSPINKDTVAVVATETSESGVLTSDPEESVAQNGGVDFIGKSEDLNADYFSFMTGRNTSSDTAANGIEYTRLTNFLVRTFEKSAKGIVGKLQSIAKDDPTRQQAHDLLTSILSDLQTPNESGYGMIDVFTVTCDLSNNPASTQALGFLFAFVKVQYLNVVRYFVIQLDGGGNVIGVTVSDTQPNLSSLVSSAA